MAWSIPDKGEGQHNLQSILYQEYMDVLVAAIDGVDCVLSGCAVTAQGSPDMTVAVAKGAVLSNSVLKAVTAGNVTISTADSTNPRLDLIVVDSSGVKQVRTGTAAATPKPPARTANDVVIAVVYVPANDTTISSAQIVDLRVLRTQGPICIHRVTTPIVFNTTSAQQTYLSLTIPDGLFLAGKILRVRLGGTYLFNSGTPTWTVVITYGDTTLFQDATAAATADADRGVWHMDLNLVAQGNSDQELNGIFVFQQTAAKNAPTTGRGDIGVQSTGAAPISGSSAVDSNAADRVFDIRFTMSVSNVNDEIAMDHASVDLV